MRRGVEALWISSALRTSHAADYMGCCSFKSKDNRDAEVERIVVGHGTRQCALDTLNEQLRELIVRGATLAALLSSDNETEASADTG